MKTLEKRENFSRKRTAILKVLQETDTHPTADWVHNELKEKYPNLSLGTVYRNLKKFCENGKAMSVGVINGQEHFDANTNPHAHFVCETCGNVIDIMENFFEEEKLNGLNGIHNHTFESAEVLFRGTCENCTATGLIN